MYEKWQVILIMIAFSMGGYMAYWNGYNKGKREGYITGRSISRVPNER